jgi:hypothetical protein
MLKLTDVTEARTAYISPWWWRQHVPLLTSVNFNVTTRRYIQEDSKLHTRRRENLKCHMLYIILWKGYIYIFDFLILKPTNYVELDPEGSSPYSREPATGSYPEPVGSTSHPPSQSP